MVQDSLNFITGNEKVEQNRLQLRKEMVVIEVNKEF